MILIAEEFPGFSVCAPMGDHWVRWTFGVAGVTPGCNSVRLLGAKAQGLAGSTQTGVFYDLATLIGGGGNHEHGAHSKPSGAPDTELEYSGGCHGMESQVRHYGVAVDGVVITPDLCPDRRWQGTVAAYAAEFDLLRPSGDPWATLVFRYLVSADGLSLHVTREILADTYVRHECCSMLMAPDVQAGGPYIRAVETTPPPWMIGIPEATPGEDESSYHEQSSGVLFAGDEYAAEVRDADSRLALFVHRAADSHVKSYRHVNRYVDLPAGDVADLRSTYTCKHDPGPF